MFEVWSYYLSLDVFLIKINAEFEEFATEADQQSENENKESGTRARKLALCQRPSGK